MLANKGHQVTWWSSNFHHATKSFRGEAQASVEVTNNWHIVLLNTPKYHNNVSLGRVRSHLMYSRALRAMGARYPEIPHLIIASSVPLSSANAALALARRCGAKTVIDVQDLWPESFELIFPVRLRWLGRILLLPLRLFANRVYGKADGITAISQTLLQRATSVSRNSDRETMVLHLGVDLHLFDRYAKQRVGDGGHLEHDAEFWAVYAGTIGKTYDIKTILEAAGRLVQSHPQMRFLIAGAGPDSERLKAYAGDRQLSNVVFTGLLDYHHLVLLLRQSDVGMSTYAAGHDDAFPNKVFDYLAAGLPIVNSAEGELGCLVRTEHIGKQYQAGNAESLARAVAELCDKPSERLEMGRKARRLAEERFDVNKEYPKLEEFLMETVSTRLVYPRAWRRGRKA